MALPNLSGSNIQDTYQRVLHTDGTNVYNGTGSVMPLQFDGNNVIIPGTLRASAYIVTESVTSVSSGSTIFGNSIDDIHQFTGSVDVSGSLSVGRKNVEIKIGTIGSIAAMGYDLQVANYSLAASNGETLINAGGSGNGITFRSQNTENMRLTHAGKLGIGISLPAKTLDVAGSFRATGNAFIAGVGKTTTITGLTTIVGDMTSSGNISSSGTISAINYLSNGLKLWERTPTSGIISSGNDGDASISVAEITASGKISASGDLHGDDLVLGTGRITTANTHIDFPSTPLKGITQITASGHISTSGNVYSKALIVGSSTSPEEDSLITLIGSVGSTTFDARGDFSGNAATATVFSPANDQILNNNKDIHGKTVSGTARHLLSMGPNDSVQVGATNNRLSIRSSGVINITGSINGAGHDISAIRHITASGNISSSGNIIGTGFVGNGRIWPDFNLSATHYLDKTTTTNPILRAVGGFNVVGNVTASGIISASGNILTSGNVTAVGTMGGSNLSGTNTGDETLSSINGLAITTLGTIGTGVWNAGIIPEAKLQNQSGTNTGDNTANTTYSNVDNTADASKPVSTAQAAAIALKSNIASPAFTGAVTASGNISSSANIYAADYYASGQKVRPNLYWFGVCDAVTLAANTSLGAFPSTDVSIVSFNATTLTSDTAVYTLSSDVVTITRAGVYKFTYNVLLEIGGGANRTEGAVGILRTPSGGSVGLIDGSRSSTYNRFAAGGVSRMAGSVSMLIDVAADDAFYIGFYKEEHQTSNTKLQTVPSGTTWTIEAVT